MTKPHTYGWHNHATQAVYASVHMNDRETAYWRYRALTILNEGGSNIFHCALILANELEEYIMSSAPIIHAQPHAEILAEALRSIDYYEVAEVLLTESRIASNPDV